MPPPKKNNSRLWDYLLLIGVSIVLLYPVLNGEASFFIKLDNLQQQYPFFQKLATSLHKGYFPTWDANTYGGKSFVGELLPGVFYPINIIWCFIFGSEKGIDVWYLDLLVVFHYFICVIGMYRLASLFQLSRMGAIVAALVFTYTGALSQRSGGQTCVFFGDTLLPWTVFFVVKYYLTHHKAKFIVLAGLTGGLQLLAGHIQPFFHTALICVIFALAFEYREWKNLNTFLASIARTGLLFLLFVFIISLPQIYYSAQYLSNCYRRMGGGYYIMSGQKIPLQMYTHWYTLKIENLANLLGQNISQPIDDDMIYMGILPLSLLIVVILKYKWLELSRQHLYLTRILFFILLAGALSVMGYVTFFPYILYSIPLVDTARELGRYVLLISFAASLLSGLTITYLGQLKERFTDSKNSLPTYVLGILLLNMLYLIFFQSKYIPTNISLPFALCFAYFFLLRLKLPNDLLVNMAIIFICLDLLINNVSYLPTRSFFYPPNYYQRTKLIDFLETTYGKYRVVFDIDNVELHRLNLGDVYNIQQKYGYAATVNRPYYEFTHLNDALNSKENDLLNIRYILTDRTLDSNFTFKDSVQGLILYERKNYYPRCYWKKQLGMRGPDIEAENMGKITQLSYSDLYQKVEVSCLRPDTLIFSENYYPGWRCYDNEKEVSIHMANINRYPGLFRAIPLGIGHHIIEFKYNKVFGCF